MVELRDIIFLLFVPRWGILKLGCRCMIPPFHSLEQEFIFTYKFVLFLFSLLGWTNALPPSSVHHWLLQVLQYLKPWSCDSLLTIILPPDINIFIPCRNTETEFPSQHRGKSKPNKIRYSSVNVFINHLYFSQFQAKYHDETANTLSSCQRLCFFPLFDSFFMVISQMAEEEDTREVLFPDWQGPAETGLTIEQTSGGEIFVKEVKGESPAARSGRVYEGISIFSPLSQIFKSKVLSLWWQNINLLDSHFSPLSTTFIGDQIVGATVYFENMTPEDTAELLKTLNRHKVGLKLQNKGDKSPGYSPLSTPCRSPLGTLTWEGKARYGGSSPDIILVRSLFTFSSIKKVFSCFSSCFNN